jgi:hypothetical protein
VYEKPANTFVAPPNAPGPHRDVVYYVGTEDAELAARILHRIG